MNISNKIKEEGFICIDYAENQYEIFHNNNIMIRILYNKDSIQFIPFLKEEINNSDKWKNLIHEYKPIPKDDLEYAKFIYQLTYINKYVFKYFNK